MTYRLPRKVLISIFIEGRQYDWLWRRKETTRCAVAEQVRRLLDRGMERGLSGTAGRISTDVRKVLVRPHIEGRQYDWLERQRETTGRSMADIMRELIAAEIERIEGGEVL